MKLRQLSQEDIQAAVDGNAAAISHLITECQPDLLQFARQACATPEDAEDAVQETLWVISQKIGNLRTINAFMGWAIRIVKHECYRLLRLARGENPLESDREIPVDPHNPEYASLQRDIVTTLAGLPLIYRQVIIMRDIQDMSAPEVAAALGIQVDAVKSRLHRARSMLRVQLQPWVE